MKPLRLTLTIELPPDGSPERDQVMRMTLSELLGIDVPPARSAPVPASRPDPPVRPHREPDPADDDEAAGVQRDDNRPMTGNQLLGWIGDQPDPRGALKRRRLGKNHGYVWQIKTWKPEQVAKVYGELTSGTWGGRAAQ